jgi:ABC-type glycerol-3-phosphate transport system substrate-binding protein
MVFVAMFGLQGCDLFSSSRKEFNEDGKRIITFWHAMGGVMGEALSDLIKEYNESQDKYHIHTEFMGRYDILEQKIIASVMAGKTPDIAQMYEATTNLLTRDKGEESLISLNDYLKEWGQFDDLYPCFKETVTFDDDQVYAMPFNKSFPVLFYNQEVLDVLGLKKAPETWEELELYSKMVQESVVLEKKTKRFFSNINLKKRLLEGDSEALEKYAPVAGYAFSVDPWHFEIVIMQKGGKLISDDKKKALFATDLAVDSLSFWTSAVSEGWGYKTEGYNHQNDFGARKVAFIITSSVSRKFMERKLNFKFGTTSVPMSGKKVSIMSGTNVCIFNGLGKERTDGAWDFLSWLVSPESTSKWAKGTYYVPVRKKALETKVMKDWLASTTGADAAISQLPYGASEPALSAWYNCRIILRSHMEKIISIIEKSGKRADVKGTTRDQLQQAVKKMNKVLEKYSVD